MISQKIYLYINFVLFGILMSSCSSLSVNSTKTTATFVNETKTIQFEQTTHVSKTAAPTVVKDEYIKNVDTIDIENFIGCKYTLYPNIPEYPESVYEIHGVLFSSYNLIFLERDDGLRFGWIAKKEISQGIYTVIDTFEIPLMEKDDIFVYGNGCLYEGQPDNNIIVIGYLDDEAYNSRFLTNDKIKYAWRYVVEDGEIVGIIEINTDGLECSSEGHVYWDE